MALLPLKSMYLFFNYRQNSIQLNKSKKAVTEGEARWQDFMHPGTTQFLQDIKQIENWTPYRNSKDCLWTSKGWLMDNCKINLKLIVTSIFLLFSLGSCYGDIWIGKYPPSPLNSIVREMFASSQITPDLYGLKSWWTTS